MKRLRNMVELFNRSVDVCEDVDEVRYMILDVLGIYYTQDVSTAVNLASKLRISTTALRKIN